MAKSDPSQNARRHGLTAALGINDALAHFRVILDAPQRVPASYATHEVDRLAYALAECEARVERATAAERTFLFGRFAHADIRVAGGGTDAAPMVLSVEDLREIVLSDAPDIAMLVAAQRERAFWREAAKLQRYRREAETARRRALRAYLRALQTDDGSEPAQIKNKATRRRKR